MNILVLVKQVPDTEKIKLKAGEEFRVEKMNLDMRLNTFDKYAIEEAARIKDASDDVNIITMTMGPEPADRAVVESLSMAADKGYLIWDEKFRGSDSLATAGIMKAAVKKIEETEGPVDLILTGRQSNDGSTAQTGIMLAELLGWNLVTSAVEVKRSSDADILEVTRRLLDGYEAAQTEMPAVVTMTKPDHEVRFPTFKRIRWANSTEITLLDADVLESAGLDMAKVGREGSNTKVLHVKKPGRSGKNAIVNVSEGQDPVEAMDELLRMLEEDKILKR